MPCEPAESKNGTLLSGDNATDTSCSPTIRPLPDGTRYQGSLYTSARRYCGIDDGTVRGDLNPGLTSKHIIKRDALPNATGKSGHGGRIYMSEDL